MRRASEHPESIKENNRHEKSNLEVKGENHHKKNIRTPCK
jgi:hypothetical protein